jgi:hypothetical protein
MILSKFIAQITEKDSGRYCFKSIAKEVKELELEICQRNYDDWILEKARNDLGRENKKLRAKVKELDALVDTNTYE